MKVTEIAVCGGRAVSKVASAIVCVRDAIVALDISEMLEKLGVNRVSFCHDLVAAMNDLRVNRYDIAFLDHRTSDEPDPLSQVLQSLRTPVVVIGGRQGGDDQMCVRMPFAETAIEDCIRGV